MPIDRSEAILLPTVAMLILQQGTQSDCSTEGETMPSKRRSSSKRGYGGTAKKQVGSAIHRAKRGKLKAGKGRHPKAKSRKQAIAIGLSEARQKGAKVPPRPHH
jgi:hypothetical protein